VSQSVPLVFLLECQIDTKVIVNQNQQVFFQWDYIIQNVFIITFELFMDFKIFHDFGLIVIKM
jgi:hypothetical protein